jgi:glycosyltransferase involved in cell wall biosynthesis
VKVGFDTSPRAQTRAGTSRYISALGARMDVDLISLYQGGSGRAAAIYRDVVWYPATLSRLARRRRLDVLHCPTFRGPLRPIACPLVVTVHDLAVLRHPEAFNAWTRHYSRICVPRVVRAATRVIAISEFTRAEVVDLLGVPADRITVIPNGIEGAFTSDGPAAGGDYLLAVGTLEPRKNLARVEQAARGLGKELRVVGASGWGRVRVEGWLGRCSDDELAELYRGATCVVYPSLYEGFGLPIAEAMACGTPVVTSRGGATEETAGGAAVLVDPFDVDDIARGIEVAIARRDELHRLGLERANAFSWETAARATMAVYSEVAR